MTQKAKGRSLIMNAKQLRSFKPAAKSRQKKRAGFSSEIYIILDNVLDTYNVGAIFRLADAVAARKLFLCDQTPTPPDPKIKKASINTTEWVDWEYSADTVAAIENLKNNIENLQVVAIEQSGKSISYRQLAYNFPLALVVGNESYGVSKKVLEVCHAIVELPMYGVNVSLNVMVSLAIVLYKALESI